jgi:hypothetical protein
MTDFKYTPKLDLVERAIAAVSEKGKKYDPEKIATSIVGAVFEDVEAQINLSKEIEDSWNRLANKIASRQPYRIELPEGYQTGEIARINRESLAAHRVAIEQQLERNVKLTASLFGALTTIGTAVATGGITAPAAITALLPVATQLVDALNEE